LESLIIFLVAFLTSIAVSKIMEFAGRKRLLEIQNQINQYNKEYTQAIKERNEEKIKELEEKMKEMPKLMWEMLSINLKSTLLILPVIIIVPYALKNIFPNFTITLPTKIPVVKFNNFSFEMRNVFGSYGWFWISFLICGFLRLGYNMIKKREKITEKKEK
jgi:uncharacterized membrane protein (DUF106 family)